MRRLAILRRLLRRFDATIWLAVLCACLFVLPLANAQSTTVIDGSQTTLVIVGANNSSSGWIAWRSKFIPEHVIFAFQLPANFTAVNPIVKCSLDDQSAGINPNDPNKWFQIALSLPNPGSGNTSFDVAAPSVGTVATSAQTLIVETGVFPCVAWAIQAAGNGNTFNGTGNSKITAVQLPSSGDAAFLSSTGTIFTSGSNRTTGNQSPGGLPGPPGVSTKPAINGPMLDNLSGTQADGGFLRADSGLGAPLGVIDYAIVSGAPQAATRIRVCQNPANATGISAATVQVVTGGGAGQNTKICDVVLSNTNATAVTASVVSGTGTNCGTGTATIIPPITLTANTGGSPTFVLSSYPLWTSGGGNNLNVCVTVAGAGSVNAMISFEND